MRGKRCTLRLWRQWHG
ncbi:hypothetical protein [Fibrobacter sp. UWB5]